MYPYINLVGYLSYQLASWVVTALTVVPPQIGRQEHGKFSVVVL